jgi:hypothetical protein
MYSQMTTEGGTLTNSSLTLLIFFILVKKVLEYLPRILRIVLWAKETPSLVLDSMLVVVHIVIHYPVIGLDISHHDDEAFH